jgi:hypothetical protein
VDEISCLRPDRTGFTPEQTPPSPRSRHPRPSNLWECGEHPEVNSYKQSSQTWRLKPTNTPGIPAGDYPHTLVSPQGTSHTHAGDHPTLTHLPPSLTFWTAPQRLWMHPARCLLSPGTPTCTVSSCKETARAPLDVRSPLTSPPVGHLFFPRWTV